MTKREITKLEKQIVNDIMSRSNYGVEKTTEIVRPMIDFGYTIHEQDYYKLKKVIEILKGMGIKLEHYPKSKNHPYVLKIKAFGDDLFFDLVNEIRYNLLKEVFGNEKGM